MLDGVAVRCSDITLTALTESVTRHKCNLFGIKQFFAEFLRRHARAFDRGECVERALRLAAGKPELTFYDKANNDKYLLDRDGKWSAQAANEYMTTILSSHSTANKNMVELIICNNDGMAEGAISALTSSGYNTGKEGATAIPVFGVDATSAAKELIKGGRMAGTIKQDAEGMAKAILKCTENGVAEKDLLDGMGDYNIDTAVDKVRIPYAVYLGEGD